MALGPGLRYVMLLAKDVPKAANFFTEGLGLRATVVTERFAKLSADVDGCDGEVDAGHCIAIKQANSG